jgi:hypothetical protein
MISAHSLALAHTQAVCGYWRGDDEFLPILDAWLTQFWRDGAPQPATAPDAVYPHGAGGRGIHWHESGPAVIGHVPGKQGWFQIPRTAVLPANGVQSEGIATIAAISA